MLLDCEYKLAIGISLLDLFYLGFSEDQVGRRQRNGDYRCRKRRRQRKRPVIAGLGQAEAGQPEDAPAHIFCTEHLAHEAIF